jgi:hypothetical protein
MTNREIMLMWLTMVLGAAIFGAGMYAARLF